MGLYSALLYLIKGDKFFNGFGHLEKLALDSSMMRNTTAA